MLRVTTVCVLAVVGACAAWLVRRRPCHLSQAQWRSRLVVITGCDSGIGYSAALHLHQRGLTVAAFVLSELSSGARELARIGQETGRMRVIAMDITKHDNIVAAAGQVEAMLENNNNTLELHVLINNAGVMVFGETEWQTERLVDLQLDVNLRGAINVTRQFAHLLRKYKGRVVNVTSQCATLPLPGLAVYAAGKAGLQAWSDALRTEWAKYGVRVISLVPGAFFQQTNILSRQQQYADEMRQSMSDEASRFYGRYFDDYHRYLSGLAGERPATPVQSKQLYHMLDDAVLSEAPRAHYYDAPWRYSLYHQLARAAPTALRDALVIKFTAMPAFNP